MNPMRLWVLVAALCTCSCAAGSGSVVIHDTPSTAVWLAADARARTGHNHPYSIPAAVMTKVLGGLQIEERDTLTGLGILGSEHAQAAFTQGEIARLTPHLIEALRKASPQDMATFYLVVGDANRRRSVTSGGLFVDATRRLHLMLANWRSVPSGGQDYTMAMELDHRDEPLLPVSPYRFRVGFYPPDAWVKTMEDRSAPSFPAYRSVYGDPAKSIVIDLDAVVKWSPTTPH